MKIAIIGSGFAGVATALSIENHEIVLFEQSEQLLPIGAGILLQPIGLMILDMLGVGEKVMSIGNKIERLYGLNENNKTVLDLKYNKYNKELYGVGIHRGQLFVTLLELLKSKQVEIKLNERIIELRKEKDKNIIISTQNEYDDFDVIVVCNGSKSELRNKIPGYKYEKEYPWGAFWGVFENLDFKESVLYQRYKGTKKLFGVLPCGVDMVNNKKLINFFWSERKSRVDDIYSLGIDRFKELVYKQEPKSQSILNQMHSFDQLLYTTYHDVLCQNWNYDNVVFIGDAIHGMSPQLGIGLNMAMFDGYALGKLLSKPAFKIDDLNIVKSRRKSQNLYYHIISQSLTRFFQSDYAVLGKVRDTVFPFFPNIKLIDKYMLNTMCGYKTGFVGVETPEIQIRKLISLIKE